jgi:magnesium-transporting ATPase (P-type)
MVVVGLSVAAIPEGLPAITTITLSIGVRAMARRHVIVRRLPTIETLGSVSVICTDKTGTLTRNEMMVASLVTQGRSLQVKGVGYKPEGEIVNGDALLSANQQAAITELGIASIVCNDADILEREGFWVVEGDPMEGALLAFAGKVSDIEIDSTRASWERVDSIPFDARHRFMATLNCNESGQSLVFVKGAPEQIMSMCTNQRSGSGSVEPLNAAYWTDQADQLSQYGQRILAFAVKEIGSEQSKLDFSDVEKGLTLLGIVGLIDPPRPESITAIKQCHDAGIRVKMITGDHAGTAAAIAKQIGFRTHILF